MSILQQRRSIVGFFVGAFAGLLLVAALGQRQWEAPAHAATQTALERKVDNLQNNLKTMQSKLNSSIARIAELEATLDGALTGTTKVGDADTLDGLDSMDFALATESQALDERVDLLEEAMTGVISGELPAGDSLKLGGKSASDYALQTDISGDLSFGLGFIRSGDNVDIDFGAWDTRYLSISGGALFGSLTVSGDVVADGAVQVGQSNGAATAATVGALRFDPGTGTLQISDGTLWRTLAFE